MSKRKVKVLVCLGCFVAGAFVGNSIAKWFNELEEQRARYSTFPNLVNCLHAIKFYIIKKLKNQSSKIFVIREVGDFVTTWPDFEADVKEVGIIGFDCEWTTKKGSRGKVALLQLATYTGLTLLIQLNKVTALPSDLLDCLSDSNIVKVGVGCIADAKKLLDDRAITVNGCFDLRFLVDSHSLALGQKLSLKALCWRYLNLELAKPRHIQCSNWDAPILNSQQIKYAAFDAVVAVQIFVSAMMERFVAHPNHITKLMDNSFQKEVWSQMFLECLKFKDLKFKDLRPAKAKSNHSRAKTSSKTSVSQLSLKSYKSYPSRTSPMYDNCMLQSLDGGVLSTCNRKKANWYIKQGLGTVVSEDPYTVRLNFTPVARPDEYYQQQFENICVVCGCQDGLVRKNVVPHDYKKFFPVELKSHESHDVLPLCVACHRKSNMIDEDFRQQIADEFDAPLQNPPRYFEDTKRRTVRSAARALAKMGDCIPKEKRLQLEQSILDFFQESDLDDHLIAKASQLETKMVNKTFVSHAEKVMSSITSRKDVYKNICEFEKMWRKNFVKTMSPAHLPRRWSVDHQRRQHDADKFKNRRKNDAKFLPNYGEEERLSDDVKLLDDIATSSTKLSTDDRLNLITEKVSSTSDDDELENKSETRNRNNSNSKALHLATTQQDNVELEKSQPPNFSSLSQGSILEDDGGNSTTKYRASPSSIDRISNSEELISRKLFEADGNGTNGKYSSHVSLKVNKSDGNINEKVKEEMKLLKNEIKPILQKFSDSEPQIDASLVEASCSDSDEPLQPYSDNRVESDSDNLQAPTVDQDSDKPPTTISSKLDSENIFTESDDTAVSSSDSEPIERADHVDIDKDADLKITNDLDNMTNCKEYKLVAKMSQISEVDPPTLKKVSADDARSIGSDVDSGYYQRQSSDNLHTKAAEQLATKCEADKCLADEVEHEKQNDDLKPEEISIEETSDELDEGRDTFEGDAKESVNCEPQKVVEDSSVNNNSKALQTRKDTTRFISENKDGAHSSLSPSEHKNSCVSASNDTDEFFSLENTDELSSAPTSKQSLADKPSVDSEERFSFKTAEEKSVQHHLAGEINKSAIDIQNSDMHHTNDVRDSSSAELSSTSESSTKAFSPRRRMSNSSESRSLSFEDVLRSCSRGRHARKHRNKLPVMLRKASSKRDKIKQVIDKSLNNSPNDDSHATRDAALCKYVANVFKTTTSEDMNFQFGDTTAVQYKSSEDTDDGGEPSMPYQLPQNEIKAKSKASSLSLSGYTEISLNFSDPSLDERSGEADFYEY